jgi:hypothetical protein
MSAWLIFAILFTLSLTVSSYIGLKAFYSRNFSKEVDKIDDKTLSCLGCLYLYWLGLSFVGTIIFWLVFLSTSGIIHW